MLLFLPAVANLFSYTALLSLATMPWVHMQYLVAVIYGQKYPLLGFSLIFFAYFLTYIQVNYLIPVYVPFLHAAFFYLTLRVASKFGLSLKGLVAYRREMVLSDLVVAALLVVVMTPIMYLLFKFFYNAAYGSVSTFLYYSIRPPWHVAALVVFSFTAGFAEEFIWRGYGVTAVESLARSRRTLKAVVVTSLAFAVWHVNLFHIIPTMVFGLVYAYVYVKRRTLVPLIMSHTAFNLLSIVLL